MSYSHKFLVVPALAAGLALGLQFAAGEAHAGKEKFQRTKPHVNIGTIGTSDQPSGPSGFKQPGKGNSNKGLGGPRKDPIDLSVCDLATFDFDKCLG